MTASTNAINPPSSARFGGMFWERLWKMSGLGFVALFLISAVICGYQPPISASADSVRSFYADERTRILIAAVLSSLNILNLLWFAAALRAALADAGQSGWGGAATASSAVLGALILLSTALSAALAYAIAQPGAEALTATLNTFSWALAVMISFPRAMLIMSGAFGLWRAKQISNPLFAAGVVAVVLAVLGGTTWASGGLWSPDGIFSRFVSPFLLLAWIIVVTRVLLARGPARAEW